MIRKNGATSNKERIYIQDSTTGQPKTGLTNASAGLIISTVTDTEASGTAYSGANIQTIATIGTFAAPSAASCRFGEVDSTNHPGLYELQFLDARYSVAGSQQLNVSVQGTGIVASPLQVQLSSVDLNDPVRMGMTALPNAAAQAAGGLYTNGTGAGQINQSVNGKVDVNITHINSSSPAATNLGTAAGTMQTGQAVTGTLSASVFTTNLASTTVDEYKGRAIRFTSGALIGQEQAISAYSAAGQMTVSTAFTTAPANSDTFIII